ncbi:MAG: hypothetical protein JSW26_19610 [Desulfobacterales bacterium]|nr:MAG: hypothetical protein JSW26_19610 [Desulfobacterales bacterium]
MQIIQEIGLQAIEILTLIFGVLGITFSVLLLFSPNLTKSLSNILNRRINFDEKIDFLDKDIEIAHFFYNHHILIGLVLVGGSAFSLFFFYFSLDVAKFTRVFLGSQNSTLFPVIIINSISWIGKIACLFGLFYGFLLVLAPGKMRQIESKLNSWFETKSIIEKLDKSGSDLDSFIFRHPIWVGLTGAVLSFFLLSLSIINLLE